MKIPRIERGDPLTALYFNRISDTINDIIELSTPTGEGDERVSAAVDGTGTNVTPENLELLQSIVDGISELSTTNENTDSGLNFIELARVSSTVRVTDPDDDTIFVDVERIDAVSFKDDEGNILRLAFTNG